MVVVIKKKGESEDKLIARFRKKVIDSGLIQEVRDRTRFKSQGDRKKEKNNRIKHLIKLEKRKNF